MMDLKEVFPMYNFRMMGSMKDSDNQKAREVLYKDGKLSGDKTLVQAIKNHAGYSKDAKGVMMVMKDICIHAEVWGTYPK
jgi:hypothetical protein